MCRPWTSTSASRNRERPQEEGKKDGEQITLTSSLSALHLCRLLVSEEYMVVKT